MRGRISVMTTLALVVLGLAAAAPTAGSPCAPSSALSPQHDHAAGSAATPAAGPKPPASAAGPTATVPAAAPRAADVEIDRLLKAMNAAEGDAKVAVMADLITRLVSERRSTPAASAAAACPMCAEKMAAEASGHAGCAMMAPK